MRQRIFFRTLLGAQFLIFLFLFGSGIYLLWLTRSNAILAEPDAPDVVHGLRLAAALCIGTCLIWGASFLGLLRRQSWGWWLGLAANFFMLAITAWDVFFDEGGPVDFTDYLIPAVFLLVTIVQLLTRPTTWKQMEIAAATVNDSQQSAGSGI